MAPGDHEDHEGRIDSDRSTREDRLCADGWNDRCGGSLPEKNRTTLSANSNEEEEAFGYEDAEGLKEGIGCMPMD